MSKVCALALGLAALTASICSPAASWQRYDSAEDGFTVSLPAIPTQHEQVIEATDTLVRTYEALVSEDRVYKFTISVGLPRTRGYYDEAAMDAFLDKFPASMAKGLPQWKLEQSERTSFRQMPARAFRVSHVQLGQPLMTRGIVFMIDGGYMRVSSLTLADDPEGPATHERFIKSFELRSLAFQPSPKQFSDAHGVTFDPPAGWLKEPPKSPNEIATYTRMTRWLEVLSTFNEAYTCRTYRGQIEASGQLQNVHTVNWSGHSAMRLTAREEVPTHHLWLSSVHYCFDTPRLGAVVFKGTAEDPVFWRYEPLFDGSARTLRIR